MSDENDRITEATEGAPKKRATRPRATTKKAAAPKTPEAAPEAPTEATAPAAGPSTAVVVHAGPITTLTGSVIDLPATAEADKWTDREKALAEAAGLVVKKGQQWVIAPRATIEAFLGHSRRTRLDPIARQIYCIERGGKWGIQISIDGARLVAQRTGEYRGQTPVQWTDGTRGPVPLRDDNGAILRDGDGVPIMTQDYIWTEVWLGDGHPAAARVGVYREGFAHPLFAVATWAEYAVWKDEWQNGSKTGSKVLTEMWQRMGALMLAKCAEMLALRKAFPLELSGLYSTEEMGQADNRSVGGEHRTEGGQPAAPPQAPTAPAGPGRYPIGGEWLIEASKITYLGSRTDDDGGLRSLHRKASRRGVLGLRVDRDSEETFGDMLTKKAATLPEHPPVDPATGEVDPVTGGTIVDAEVVTEGAAA